MTSSRYARRAARPVLLAAALIIVTSCVFKREATPGSDARPASQTPAKTHPVSVPPPTPEADPAAITQRMEQPASGGMVATAPSRDRTWQGVPLAAEAITACCPDGGPRYFPQDREQYAHLDQNPVKLAREQPVSTFSIDVDTGSYSNIRRFLNEGTLPPQDAVRVEELINYFSYDYPAPRTRDRPFSVSTAVAPAPWNRDKLLLQIGIKGFEVPAERRSPANLVFLIDVSGSMQPDNKLPLLKRSMRLLARQLRHTDRVSMVVYAGAAGAVLPPTPGDRQAEILAALDQLEAGGSTNGGDGIRLAYDFAHQAYIKGGINRVLLATDGDFNVGTVDFNALVDIVERERQGGIALTTLGFGAGNYNDKLLEKLADSGNGNYAYIDGLNEGRKVLVEQVSGTLQTIAKDVKIQVEFNPDLVAEYRLIGYENRMLRREDFNNDRIDAGEIGAGHSVTALYELALAGSPGALVDPLRYGGAKTAARGDTGGNDELAFVRLRYKAPDGDKSKLIEQPVRQADVSAVEAAPRELRFAAAVAAFGQMLRGGEYTGDFSYEGVARLAAGARGDDPSGYRGEFLSLVRLADTLATRDRPPEEPVAVEPQANR